MRGMGRGVQLEWSRTLSTQAGNHRRSDPDFTGHALRGLEGTASTTNPLLGVHDMQARYYVPGLAMFAGVDPLADQFAGFTPYHYVHGDPVNLVDPTGASPIEIQRQLLADGEKKRREESVGSCPPGEACGDLIVPSASEVKDAIVEGLSSFAQGLYDLVVGGGGEAATYTDVNDVAVLTTAVTGSPMNTDGSEAGPLDVVAAGAGSFIPYVSGSGVLKGGRKVANAISETMAGRGNFTGTTRLTESEALQAGVEFVGENARELGRNGSGVYRSLSPNPDGTSNQFRMDNGSLEGNHPPSVSHVHLEIIRPNGRIQSNNHVILNNKAQ